MKIIFDLLLRLRLLLLLPFLIFLFIKIDPVNGQFVQIESILVDACDGTIEGENEMVSFRVESLPISVSDIRVDGAGSTGVYTANQWPNPTNLFLGWITGGTAEYTTVKSKVDGINASIIHCGYLILMTTDSVIPAGKKGLIITSTDFTPTANDFTLLSDTLYVIFQKAGNTQGHFVNYSATSSMRYLRLHKISTGIDEDVSYDRSLLVMISGAVGQEDGAGVRFTTAYHTDNETDTYYNDGCQAPYIPLDPGWTAPPPLCQNDPAIDLNSLVTGTAGGTWSGTGVAGSIFDPTGMSGSFTITYTLGTSVCQITNFTESHTITVNAAVTPTFTALGPYCVGATPGTLPATSNNGISGTWNPTTISTAAMGTTTYTFTPSAGQCATSTTMSVTISNGVTPTFTALGPYCTGATPDPLPSTSLNGITGTWSPSAINTATAGTATYTFTPTSGQCASSTTMSITVGSSITPSFTALGPYCIASVPQALPTVSTNGISGTWNPSSINTLSLGPATYTFTPASGQCASVTTMIVTITDTSITTFNPIGPYCQGEVPGLLPTTSTNGITGTWSPATISTSAEGTLTYTFTPDAGQCAQTASMTITVNPNPVLSTSSTDEHCAAADGTATVASSGSCPGGYTYSWSTIPAQTTATATNLSGGIYTVTVSCGACSASASVTVNASTGPSISIDTVINSNCNTADGGVNISVSGGASPYSFSWNSIPPQSSQNLQNVGTGNYTVTVTDATGCSSTASAAVNNISGPVIQVVSTSNAHCGQANGSAEISVSGGLAPYSFSWNSSPAQTGQNLQNVVSGNYSVTVTDSLGCIATADVAIDNIPGPAVSVLSVTDANCGASDGSVSISLTGGTQPFTFLWNTTPAQNTQNISGVPAGIYSVTVTDSSGCTDTLSAQVAMTGSLVLSASATDETCGQMNGSAAVSVSGGSGTYVFSWSTIPQQTTPAIYGLAAGMYQVTVSDGSCSATAQVTVNNDPGPDAYISVTPPIITVYDDPATLTGNSDGQIVSWAWDLGDGSTGFGQSLDHEYADAGIYLVTLTVTDNNGCVVIVTDTVVVNDVFTLYIPNTFTPDDDGKNDLFMPVGLNVDTTDFYMSIYDRWGELIFETKVWGEGWNGTKYNQGTRYDAMQDVYVYRIVAHKVNGRVTEYIGRITIMK